MGQPWGSHGITFPVVGTHGETTPVGAPWLAIWLGPALNLQKQNNKCNYGFVSNLLTMYCYMCIMCYVYLLSCFETALCFNSLANVRTNLN